MTTLYRLKPRFQQMLRPLAFGALGLWVGLASPLPEWVLWAMPALAAGLVSTIVNRVRAGTR